MPRFNSLVDTAMCEFEVDLCISRARQYQSANTRKSRCAAVSLSIETDAHILLLQRPQKAREPAPPALVLTFFVLDPTTLVEPLFLSERPCLPYGLTFVFHLDFTSSSSYLVGGLDAYRMYYSSVFH
jgi:hypothetical protein